MNVQTKIHWVSGKGGVGKSTFASMKAMALALEGKRTLLVEIGDRSFYTYVSKKEVVYEPQAIAQNLYISHWDWQTCLKEYVTYLVKLTSLVNLFFDNSVMKSILEVAPGLAEISILGKLTSGIRGIGPQFDWDHIVLDAHSTGHTLSYLTAPKALYESIGIGPLGKNAKEIEDVLQSDRLSYYAVSLPEDMPVNETVEFVEQCQDKFGHRFQIILNQYLSEDFFDTTKTTNEDFKEYVEQKQARQDRALTKLKEFNIQAQIPFISRQGEYLDWIKRLLEASRGVG